MTVYVPGLRTLSDERHVAAHAFAKGVDGMDSGQTGLYMAREALLLSRTTPQKGF